MNSGKSPSFHSSLSSRRSVLKGGLAAAVTAPFFLATERRSLDAETLPVPKPVQFSAPVASPARMDRLFDTIKRTASNEELYRFLYAMPKGGDIHHHLGGGFLPSMWLSIATDTKRNGGQVFYTRYRTTAHGKHPLLSRPGVSHIFLWQTLNAKHYNSLSPAFQADFKPLSDLDPVEQEAWKSAVVLDEDGEGRDEFFEYHWSRLWDLTR
ncbi:MAG: hypothetical protein AAGH40_12020, partial [Verrucomicrobiota bacterium]